jgi:hypothetical protein
MHKRNTIILIIILIVIGIAVFSLSKCKKFPQELNIFPDGKEETTPFDTEEISVISEQLDDLSPEDAVLGGNWFISQVAVIDEKHVYIVYEDGHIVRRMLLEKTEQDWQRLAYFEPGKDMWKLISGNDPYMGNDVIIYERREEGNWVLHGVIGE